ncbi:peptidoglycan DD-metalloendopeptidase family protein [Nocardioides rotundus]|uniref:M23 family metallopeptidase n=1 Tax=Nocardioides rotundus TaxID=1774216 RepID=UPI001CBE9927|nr:M23 family metallopeptidase [Nocardioides rotundus]UAL29091.1 peptidoglycan DD-metalloendopeptidase family protein [Nocardioides rotundus]
MTATLSLAALAIGSLAVPQAFADDDLKERKQRVEKSIDRAQDELEHSSSRANRAAQRLSKSREQLDAARAELAAVRVDLTAAQARDAAAQDALDAAVAKLQRTRAEVADGKSEMEDQRREVEDMVVSMYRSGDPDLITFEALLNAETPGELASEQTVREALVDDQEATYDALRASQVLLQVREQQVEEARDAVRQRREEAAQNLARTESLEQQAVTARDAVSDLVSADRQARAQADRVRAADAAELRRLEAKERKVREQIRQRALAALRRARAAKSSAAQRSDSSGFFTMPADGYISSPYGYRKHPIYGYWGLHNGTDFSNGGQCGGPLYAAADGTVMKREYTSVYGNRLYLDYGVVRGRGLVSIYNHAQRYIVDEGDRVKKGQVIGYVGTTGWSTGCHLHFTLLENGSYADAMKWF